MSGTQRLSQGQRIFDILGPLDSRRPAGSRVGVDQCPPHFYLGPSVLGRTNSCGPITALQNSSQGAELITIWQLQWEFNAREEVES